MCSVRPKEQVAPVAALERVQYLCEDDKGDEEQCGVDKGTHDLAPAGGLLHRAAGAWRSPGLQPRAAARTEPSTRRGWPNPKFRNVGTRKLLCVRTLMV